MAESESHKRTKRRAAGTHGQTEVPLGRKGDQRLDALTSGGGRATEVERSGDPGRLRAAARRLKRSGATQHVLQVPQKDLDVAAEAMRDVGVTGSVRNMTGTKRRSI